ncbi:MAG: phospholipase D-like domain-containing protein [Verrucomicrobiales bacterium]|nr:phospholipase D-like domain-containing protein [Verrucomicrobiales bacterium]
MSIPIPNPENGRSLIHLESLVGEPWTSHNRVVILENGDEIFPAMLEAIDRAERDIVFLTYVYWQGEVAHQFAEKLAKKAREGVHCQVLLDFHGSIKTKWSLLNMMEEAGVVLAKYNPFCWSDPLRYQHRTHRKILVCDSRVGFVGGVGIADEWKGCASNPGERHDFHFRVDGPSVKSLSEAFCDNWESPWTFLRGGGKPPEAIRYDNPEYDKKRQLPVENSGVEEDVRILPLVSSPRETKSEASNAYAAMLHSAKNHIRIISAYLIPDQGMIDLFRITAQRGVRIELVIPGPFRDSWLAQSRSRTAWRELLECGVELYLYQPTMCHAKATIIDDTLTTVGSINFDLLSFRLNEEVNIIIHSRSFAEMMIEKFNNDKSKSLEMTLEEFEKRSAWMRLKERASRLLPLPYWRKGCGY